MNGETAASLGSRVAGMECAAMAAVAASVSETVHSSPLVVDDLFHVAGHVPKISSDAHKI